MKAHIAISILNSLLLTATALPTHAAEESIDDHKPKTATDVIALGPTETHFHFNALWEKQFINNNDANQDHMSMAVSDGYVFIGLVYYDNIDNRKGNLFIRQFDTSTGEEADFTLNLPPKDNDTTYSLPVIFNDESGDLFWAYAVQEKASNAPEKLMIYSIDYRLQNYSFVKSHDIGVLNSTFSSLYLESIDYVKGSVKDSTEEMRFLFADNENGNIRQYLIFIKDNDFRSVEIPVADGVRRNAYDHQSIAWHPTKTDIFAIQEFTNNNSTYQAPRVFQAAYNGGKWTVNQFDGKIETQEMQNHREQYPHAEYSGNAFCLGIHAFEHQGVPFAVLPIVNSSYVCQFQLVGWPESQKMTQADNLTLLPEYPFSIKGLQFRNLRQLIKTEKINAGVSSRADIGEPTTRLYIFSPSAGIAAYSFGAKIIDTGIDDIEVDKETLQLSGHTLLVKLPDAREAVIIDNLGRILLRAAITNGSTDLSSLSSGMYIVRVGRHIAKIAL